jgi:hypothetical protein
MRHKIYLKNSSWESGLFYCRLLPTLGADIYWRATYTQHNDVQYNDAQYNIKKWFMMLC